MKPSSALKLLAIALTSLSAGMLSAAAEERPRLQDYPSSYEYIQAMLAWNKAHPDGTTSTSQDIPPPAPVASAQVLDPTSEQAPPPFEITGPESLDVAVEKAREIEHPAYKEKVRYHRSTHLSFPLHSIDGQDMSQASVSETLNIKGKTEAEKKADLQRLASHLEEDPLKQKELQSADDSNRLPMPSFSGNSVLPSGPRAKVDISVSSH